MEKVNKTYSDIKNTIVGGILMVYLTGFLVLAPVALEQFWKVNNQPFDSNTYFLYYIFAWITFLSAFTIVIKRLITREQMTINFWTFIPAIYFSITYTYLYINRA